MDAIDTRLKELLDQYVDASHPLSKNTKELHANIKNLISYYLTNWDDMNNKECILSALNENLFYVATTTPLQVLKEDEFDVNDKI